MYYAHVKHGYTLSEIGDVLGTQYSTVSKVVKKIEGRHKEHNSIIKS
jgi:DNA-binding MarR family transcriptional regulator